MLCDPSSLDGRSEGPGLARLFNHEKPIASTPLSDHIIQSGDEIQLTTEDPENRPLPHWEILEMQWILNRVVAMSGAAEVNEFDNNDDDGGGGGGGGEVSLNEGRDFITPADDPDYEWI